MTDSALVDSVHNGYHVPAMFSPVVAVYIRATMANGVPTIVANGSSSNTAISGDTGVYTATLPPKAARLLMFTWASIQAEAAGVDFQIELDYDPATGIVVLEGSAATAGTAADVPDGDYLFKFELAMRSPGT